MPEDVTNKYVMKYIVKTFFLTGLEKMILIINIMSFSGIRGKKREAYASSYRIRDGRK